MATLFELIRQESGIIIFGENVTVFNCASLGDAEIPVLGPFSIFRMGYSSSELEGDADALRKAIPHEAVDDIRTLLPGSIHIIDDNDNGPELEADFEIIDDYNGDIFALWGFHRGTDSKFYADADSELMPTSGTAWYIANDVVIIAPDGWN